MRRRHDAFNSISLSGETGQLPEANHRIQTSKKWLAGAFMLSASTTRIDFDFDYDFTEGDSHGIFSFSEFQIVTLCNCYTSNIKCQYLARYLEPSAIFLKAMG